MKKSNFEAKKKLFDFPFFNTLYPIIHLFPLCIDSLPRIGGEGGEMIIQQNIIDSNHLIPCKNNYLAEKAFLDPDRTSRANCYMPARGK